MTYGTSNWKIHKQECSGRKLPTVYAQDMVNSFLTINYTNGVCSGLLFCLTPAFGGRRNLMLISKRFPSLYCRQICAKWRNEYVCM